MKICLVSEEYPDETAFGGIATYQKIVAETLVKKGHKVYVITRGMRKEQRYIENGVNIYRIHVNETSDSLQNAIEYRKRVEDILLVLQEKEKIDIIETPDWGAETIFFESRRNIPLIVRLHTPLKIWKKYNKSDKGNLTDELLRWEEKMLYSADYITCCSNLLKDYVLKEFKIKSEEIEVIPNPADTINFYRDDKIDKEYELIFVGSLEDRQGVLVLAKALNEVFRKEKNLKVKFIGKDTNRNQKDISTKEYIKKIILQDYWDKVEFLGQIDNMELNRYLNKALIGVFPSLFENFPYVALEGMATGLHIISTDNSGVVEMLDDNTCICKSGDEEDLAKKILEKLEYAKDIKVNFNNIERVKKEFNSEKVCDNLISIYKKILKLKGKNNV